jgi:hypothetical protein
MGNGGIAAIFLTSALDGDEWSASRLCLFAPPPGKELLYPLDRRLGRPQSRSGRCGNRTRTVYTELSRCVTRIYANSLIHTELGTELAVVPTQSDTKLILLDTFGFLRTIVYLNV